MKTHAFLLCSSTILLCACSSGNGSTPTPPSESADLVFSTYFTSGLNPREVLFDSSENIIVVGHSGLGSQNPFPQATLIGPITNSTSNVLIAKLTPDGQLIWITFIGGSGIDRGYGADLDPQGNIYVAGRTSSLDFPTTVGGFDRTNNGGGCAGPHGCNLDGYVLKLSADGKKLIHSTYVGGSEIDGFRGGLTVDEQGQAYAAGMTYSKDYPGAVNNPIGGPKGDAVITKLSADGSSIVYSRYLGSSNNSANEGAMGVAVDSLENVYVHSIVGGDDALTTNDAFDRTFNGGQSDTYFIKLSADGRKILYATYLGGSGDEWAEHAIVLDSNGNVYMAGQTRSMDFPIVQGHQPKPGSRIDAYLIKLDAAGQPLFSTYLGGSDEESAFGPAVDGNGNVFVSGLTKSPDFEATPNAYAGTFNGVQDAFLQVYGPTGQLLYSTFLGGSESDFSRYVDVDVSGNPVIVGHTLSDDFPRTPGAHDVTYDKSRGENGFITKFVGPRLSLVGARTSSEPYK